MFVVGMDVDSRLYFSIATAVIAIPTAVKVFSYASTYMCARFMHSSVLTLCFLSFLITFILGGVSGLLLSSAGLDFVFHDSYFVVGHFHTVLSLATVFGLLLAVFGLCHFALAVAIPESQFSINTLAMLSGALLIFVPMHLDGTRGMTRRVPESPDVFLPTMMLGS
jgi:heme/copper-type cytochrome/quinol oxidase subunit 1